MAVFRNSPYAEQFRWTSGPIVVGDVVVISIGRQRCRFTLIGAALKW